MEPLKKELLLCSQTTPTTTYLSLSAIMNIQSKLPSIVLCSLLVLGQAYQLNAQETPTEFFPGTIKDVYTDWLATVSYNKTTFIESPYDTTTGAALHWNIVDDMIYLAVAVTQATGWAAFGLAESGSMRGADIVMYTAETDALTDAYVLDELVQPSLDTCQSWTLINSVVDEGFIIFEAKRLLNTSDAQDRAIIDDTEFIIPSTRVIAAWGNDTTPSYHFRNVARGAVRFFGTPEMADDESFFFQTVSTEAEGNVTLSADNYIIPSDVVTTYARFCFSSNDLMNSSVPMDQDLHVIGFEPFVQPGNTKYVHHYILYASEMPFNYTNASCAEEYPALEIAYVWAPGDFPLALPANVGGPLGARGYQSYALEIHYNNADMTPNVSDNSGVRVYYTSQKRQYDLGVFQTGDPFVALQETFVNENGGDFAQHTFVCEADCLTNHLPEPVTVIRESLHMHKTGATASNEHIRNGQVLRSSRVNFWDFEQQGDLAVVQAPFQLNPGDSFRTVCNYNSPNDVIWGLASEEEMCIAFLYYYPRTVSDMGIAISCGLGFNDFLPGCEVTYNVTTSQIRSLEEIRTFGGAPSSPATCPNNNDNAPVSATAPKRSPVSAPTASTSSASSMWIPSVLLVMSSSVIYFY